VVASEKVVYDFPYIHGADIVITTICWPKPARSNTGMADRRGHLSHYRCHYRQPPHTFRTTHRCHAMSHHNTSTPPLTACTRYMSGRALEMLGGRSVGHQTRQNRLHRPSAPSSDRHVIGTRENLAEWQRSRINITHARTRGEKKWRGSEGDNMLSRGNGFTINEWFTFCLSSPLEPAWQLRWPTAESSRSLVTGCGVV
jgi:hypothetical protein